MLITTRDRAHDDSAAGYRFTRRCEYDCAVAVECILRARFPITVLVPEGGEPTPLVEVLRLVRTAVFDWLRREMVEVGEENVLALAMRMYDSAE